MSDLQYWKDRAVTLAGELDTLAGMAQRRCERLVAQSETIADMETEIQALKTGVLNYEEACRLNRETISELRLQEASLEFRVGYAKEEVDKMRMERDELNHKLAHEINVNKFQLNDISELRQLYNGALDIAGARDAELFQLRADLRMADDEVTLLQGEVRNVFENTVSLPLYQKALDKLDAKCAAYDDAQGAIRRQISEIKGLKTDAEVKQALIDAGRVMIDEKKAEVATLKDEMARRDTREIREYLKTGKTFRGVLHVKESTSVHIMPDGTLGGGHEVLLPSYLINPQESFYGPRVRCGICHEYNVLVTTLPECFTW